MFFQSIADLPALLERTSCVILALPEATKLPLKNALYLYPDDTSESKTRRISIASLREFIAHAASRETIHHYYIISPADTMTPEAQNAFLKTLEEPTDYCHFVLLTENPGQLLPTIRSRAQFFAPRRTNTLDTPPNTDAKITALAKKLISAAPRDLLPLAEEISKKKPRPRQVALDATATAIELLYKSYFKTGSPKLLAKLPKFLALHDALTRGGNLKLQIVAQLL